MMVLCEAVGGGAETMALEVVRALQGRGVEFTVAALRRGGVLIDAFRRTGADVRDGLAWWRFDPLCAYRLARLVRQKDIQAVVVIDVPRNAMFAAFVGAALSGRCVPTSCWCHSLPGGQSGPFLRQLKLYSRLRMLNSVICVSERQRQVLAAAGLRRRRMLVIRNGVDVRRFAEASPADLPGGPGKCVFVQVANVMPDKDYATLLEAAKRLAERRQDFHLVLVGSGTDSPAITAQIAQAGLAALVTPLGFRANIPQILAAADVFVLSTRREVLNLSTLEAMAAGLPVIAPDIPAFDGIFVHQREGLTFDAGDPQSLMAAMTQALDDDLRSRLAAASKRRGEQFDLRHTADCFRRLLEHICHEKGAFVVTP